MGGTHPLIVFLGLSFMTAGAVVADKTSGAPNDIRVPRLTMCGKDITSQAYVDAFKADPWAWQLFGDQSSLRIEDAWEQYSHNGGRGPAHCA